MNSYHYAFGPLDKRNAPKSKEKSHNFTQKRGCQTHFNVRVMYGRPNIAIITYNEFSHQDANGEFYH